MKTYIKDLIWYVQQRWYFTKGMRHIFFITFWSAWKQFKQDIDKDKKTGVIG